MSDKIKQKDIKFMKSAIKEAEKGIGCTSPNPSVGCVIVKKGKIIGRGYHRGAGGPHAEIEAIKNAKKTPIAGSTIYITLEPCSTHGKTPPCSNAIIEGGFKRVVFGINDPDPRHQGNSMQILRKQGIDVTTGVLSESCRRIIRPFTKRILTGLPWVLVKAGMSLDGRLTRPGDEGQWITNEHAIKDTQNLRAEVDAIIIGSETLRKDDPRLTIREAKLLRRRKNQPKRVVITRTGKLPKSAKIFTDEFRENTLVYTNRSLKAVLKNLADKHQCNSVMIEGGGTLIGNAIKRKLVDEVCLYFAPSICGQKCKPFADVKLSESCGLSEIRFKALGDNFRIRGTINS